MRTKNILKHLILGVLVLTTGKMVGQVTTGGNVAAGPTDFLGWDNTMPNNNFPLMVRHDLNQPIHWFTNNEPRMVLNQDVIGQMVNGFPNLDLTGYLGVGDFETTNTVYRFPSARVHVENHASLEKGYKPMIGDGFLATQGEALYYGGLLGNGHSGILWSWATGSGNTPRPFRFIYTGDNTTVTVSSTDDGLEMARFQPDVSHNEGYFGIGDWTTAGIEPEERLDILDRTIRLRDFSPLLNTTYLNQDPTVNRVLVADEDDGTVFWRPLSDFASDCDWEINPNDDVVTAYLSGPINGCPDESNNVGIGIAEPRAKLHVFRTVPLGPVEDIGILSELKFSADQKVGVDIVNTEEATSNFGLRSIVDGAIRNWGVVSFSGAEVANGSTVAGFFQADGENLIGQPIAVWGRAINNPTGGPGAAGWFDGYTYCTSGMWSGSDAALKDNVQDLTSALAVIDQLHPKSYNYLAADYPSLAFDTETHFGMIAQDVEQVLPALVREATHPALYDSLGNEIAAELNFKAMNYEGFIPWLIAGMKEQQSQIDQLQQDLASCCADPNDGTDHMMQGGGTQDARGMFEDAKNDDRLTIVPNPFTDQTTLSYVLHEAGQVQLQVQNSAGMHIGILRQQQQEAGAYSMTWHTQDLAPGTYFVSLYADGKPIVKKAVKVK